MVSRQILENAKDSQGGIRCYKCGKRLRLWTRIHYVPVEKGGVREYEPVCRECEQG